MGLGSERNSHEIAALRRVGAKVPAPGDQFVHTVMGRIRPMASESVAEILQDAKPGAPNIERISAAVRLRIGGVANARRSSIHSLERYRSARWVTAAGAVLAVGLVAATFLLDGAETPSRPNLAWDGTSNLSRDEGVDLVDGAGGALWSDAEEEWRPEALRRMTGQIRAKIYQKDGAVSWVVSKGAIEGVRLGDRFVWASHGKPDQFGDASLTVTGIDRFNAIVSWDGDSSGAVPALSDWVRPATVSRVMLESLRRMSTTEGRREVLIGPGFFVKEEVRGVVVTDVIPEWWPMDGGKAFASLAGQAGILAGDVLIELNGMPVRSMDELDAAISRTPVGEEKFRLLVLRGGERVELSASE